MHRLLLSAACLSLSCVFATQASLAATDGRLNAKIRGIDCNTLKGTLLLNTMPPLVNASKTVTGKVLQLKNPQKPFVSTKMQAMALANYRQAGHSRASDAELVSKIVKFATTSSPVIRTRRMSQDEYLRYDPRSREILFTSGGTILFAGIYRSEEEMRIRGEKGYPFNLPQLLEERLFIYTDIRFAGEDFGFRNRSELDFKFKKSSKSLSSIASRFPGGITPTAYLQSAQEHLSESGPQNLSIIFSDGITDRTFKRIVRISLEDENVGAKQTGMLITEANQRQELIEHSFTTHTDDPMGFLTYDIMRAPRPKKVQAIPEDEEDDEFTGKDIKIEYGP